MKNGFKLNYGDEIRIIAPSQSFGCSVRRVLNYNRAKDHLESQGFKVSYGGHIKNVLHEGTAKREDRANDFNKAFADNNVKLVMALSGGWSANEILSLIDWDIVKNNPKPLIGFSDITVLLNAIYAKTGQVCLLGPTFSTFGRMTEWRYTMDNFLKSVSGSTCECYKSNRWKDHGSSRYHITKPWKTLKSGYAEAPLLGGNLGTFYLLQGTEYQPKFNEPFIFALEDDDESGKFTLREVSRRFESLLQLPGFRDNLTGLIIGRFQTTSKVSDKALESIIESKSLGNIPIITRVDFGHTLPIMTLPIGGVIKLNTNSKVKITY